MHLEDLEMISSVSQPIEASVGLNEVVGSRDFADEAAQLRLFCSVDQVAEAVSQRRHRHESPHVVDKVFHPRRILFLLLPTHPLPFPIFLRLHRLQITLCHERQSSPELSFRELGLAAHLHHRNGSDEFGEVVDGHVGRRPLFVDQENVRNGAAVFVDGLFLFISVSLPP